MSLTLALLAASGGHGGGTTPAPTVAPLRWDGSTPIHVTVDANSHYAKWAYPAINEVGALATLLRGAGATATNVAIPGQTWADMRMNAQDVDGAYVDGKTNVLVCGDTTNSIFGGWSGVTYGVDGTLAEARRYLAARRAAHPDWIILVCGTIPRGGTPDYAQANADARTVDETMRADLADLGAHGYCDFRADPYFDDDGTDAAASGWMGVSGLCMEDAAPFIHPLGAARDSFAARIASALQTLPAHA